MPVTPLRRSERLRRPTAKAFGSSPGTSPGTAAYVSPSIGSRSRVFSHPDSQTDSDSSLWYSTSSKSSGSCMEDTVGDATNPTGLVSRVSSKLYETYERLASIMLNSDAELMKRVSLSSLFKTSNPSSSVPTLPQLRAAECSRFKWLSQRAERVPFVCRFYRPMVRI